MFKFLVILFLTLSAVVLSSQSEHVSLDFFNRGDGDRLLFNQTLRAFPFDFIDKRYIIITWDQDFQRYSQLQFDISNVSIISIYLFEN